MNFVLILRSGKILYAFCYSRNGWETSLPGNPSLMIIAKCVLQYQLATNPSAEAIVSVPAESNICTLHCSGLKAGQLKTTQYQTVRCSGIGWTKTLGSDPRLMTDLD